MRTVDLFSGCGGLSKGFELAGFEILSAFDNWAAANIVYSLNFKHPVITLDLLNTDRAAREINQFTPDIIIGGSPCQDFSSAGKRDENNGRGDLTVSFADIVAKVRPQWFLMENVARISSSTKLQIARTLFKESGYGLTELVLDASLCGVPQKRKRFVLIGKLWAEDNFLLYPLLQHQAKESMTVRDYLGDSLGINYYYRHPRSYMRRGIFSIDEPSPTIRGVNRPIPAGYVLHPNDPVTTLAGVRPLTTKERSLLQTFPSDYKFIGSKTDLEQMIGNAVPVKLASYLGEIIRAFSDNF